MRYALVGGARVEPQPKTRGICLCCNGHVTAKCGEHVVWHWAHLSRTHCDPWWEPETQWHRNWKNRFPALWQEVILYSTTGDKHIADVRTPHGLVLEFQRSTIHPDEVAARENFYQKIVWVIDGTRSEFDGIYFKLGRSVLVNGVAHFTFHGRSKLFHRWHRLKPVFIDFGPEGGFWRVVTFNPKTRGGVVLLTNPDAFAALASTGETDFSRNGGPASPWVE